MDICFERLFGVGVEMYVFVIVVKILILVIFGGIGWLRVVLSLGFG